MEFILVVLVYAGVMAKGDSVSLVTVQGFQSVAACQAAGRELAPLVSMSTKEVRFVCLKK